MSAGAPSFSRLQLAAALLEYDNDPDDPQGPLVNAKESAIFAHLRRAPQRPAYPESVHHKSVGYFQPRVPNDGMPPDNRRSVVPTIVNAEDEAEEDSDTEVLESWGLGALVDNEKENQSDAKGERKGSRASELLHNGRRLSRTLSEDGTFPNPHGPPTPSQENSDDEGVRPGPLKRPYSMGDMDDLVRRQSAEYEAEATEIAYRRSMHINLDFTSSKELSQEEVAFPSSASPVQSPQSPAQTIELPNPFEVPLSPSHVSRFDPKFLAEEDRRKSFADPTKTPTESGFGPLSVVPQSSRGRRGSMATLGTQMMLDDQHPSPLPSPNEQPDPRRLTRLELLRPKVLIMPSPLQDQKSNEPQKKVRDGFFVNDDGGIPLPPGVRTEGRPGVRTSTLNPNIAYQNPRVSMSLSQLTFRQSLMIGGQRDPSYADVDRGLRRAEHDGEQIQQEWSDDEDEEDARALRPAGKLYGRSLIDDLEARKAQIKGKQRVFTGDDRPSMMARPSVGTRGSTFIDLNDLGSRPSTQYLTPTQVQEELKRRRASGAPLLDFDGDKQLSPAARGTPAGLGATKSVFGVDKIWERELAKLKAQEELEKDEDAKLKALDARIQDKKKAMAARQNSVNSMTRASTALPLVLPEPERSGSLMPDLPKEGEADESDQEVAPNMGRRESSASLGARGWFAPGSDDEYDERRVSMASTMKPPFSRKASAMSNLPQMPEGADSDEEDVPLAQQLAAKRGTRLSVAVDDSDSDEDKPIAALKRSRSKSSTTHSTAPTIIPPKTFQSISADLNMGSGSVSKGATDGVDESSDDDVPLAVQHPSASRLSHVPKDDDSEDEDDKPLGAKLNPNMAAATMQQQQYMQQQLLQQQIMLQTQAQLRASMAFGGPMMNPMMNAGFASPFGPAAMSVQSLNFQGMQAADPQAAQASRVDQWRRNVVG